jgi:hypothetical protein
MWDYFLSSAYSQLNLPVPPNTGPGQVDVVQRSMVDRVHGMWVEARTKYMRRNLDHMSIMLSTWTTARVSGTKTRSIGSATTSPSISLVVLIFVPIADPSPRIGVSPLGKSAATLL